MTVAAAYYCAQLCRPVQLIRARLIMFSTVRTGLAAMARLHAVRNR